VNSPKYESKILDIHSHTPFALGSGVVTMWIRAICRTKMGVSVAPGLETWRVPRSMVIIEPEGQERSNPEEPRP
jgi:hypothetical protein